MYTHRGAYLNSLGEIVHSGHTRDSVYLWTLPMFHCNGWCTPWAVTAIGGTHVCLRAVRGDEIWQLIDASRRHPPQRRARPSSPPILPTPPPAHRWTHRS